MWPLGKDQHDNYVESFTSYQYDKKLKYNTAKNFQPFGGVILIQWRSYYRLQ